MSEATRISNEPQAGHEDSSHKSTLRTTILSAAQKLCCSCVAAVLQLCCSSLLAGFAGFVGFAGFAGFVGFAGFAELRRLLCSKFATACSKASVLTTS